MNLNSELRLKRLDQVFATEPIYFITAITKDRKALLNTSFVHESFIQFCQNGLERGVFVGRYCLMPDHLHLFVTFGGEYEEKANQTKPRDLRISKISAWVKSLKNALSKSLRESNVPSPHWQKGFFDHVMRSAGSYSEKWQYVAENPVRKNLAETPKQWPYQGEIYPLSASGHAEK